MPDIPVEILFYSVAALLLIAIVLLVIVLRRTGVNHCEELKPSLLTLEKGQETLDRGLRDEVARNVEQLRASLDSVKIEITPELRAEILAFSPTPPPATDRLEELQDPVRR